MLDMGAAGEGAEKLTLAVYRLTRVFPQDEPLRLKLREVALTIAVRTKQLQNPAAEEALEEMFTLLAIASAEGLAKKENFTLLRQCYEKLKTSLLNPPEPNPSAIPESRVEAGKTNKEEETAGDMPVRPSQNKERLARSGAENKTLNARQKKIIQYFRNRELFQLREVRALFEGYSQKTIRNDLKMLCRMGILNREGVGTVSFYRVTDRAM